MKRLICFLLCLSLLPCLSLTARAETSGSGDKNRICFTDHLGQSFEIDPPERVVAMTGSFAQIWCLAGGKDSLVAAAADSWSSFELELSPAVVNIGVVKEPSLELILASAPDLILASCNTEANMEMKPILDASGIPAAYFDIQHIDDYLDMLESCTRLTGCEENYREYGEKVKEQSLAAISRADGSRPSVLCMRATGSSCKVKGSRDFLLGEMLADLGCMNIADSENSLLEELSFEVIMKADPDYIFVVIQGSNPSRAEETLKKTLLENPAWQELSAVREGRFHTLEHQLYNLKPNDRWGESYEKLADILYPEK